MKNPLLLVFCLVMTIAFAFLSRKVERMGARWMQGVCIIILLFAWFLLLGLIVASFIG